MANLLPNPKQQYLTATGAPLVGGKVYTYAAGTLNLQTTFQNAAGNILNTNPVVLDARGEASIFWSGTYKVKITDAAGSEIYTQDYVSDSSTSAQAYAAAAAASALTAVNAPGTSGTSTTSLTLGIGVQSFTTQTVKAWVVGQNVNIARTSAPTVSSMYGTISAYNSGTGAMSVNIAAIGDVTGSGTFTDWTIGLAGAKGNIGTTGNTGPTGATGATGASGAAATVTAGTTTTGAPGTSASVTNSGTSSAAVFDFVVPRGTAGTGSGTVTSVSGTAPIVAGGTAPDPVISISAATGSTPGSMSAADFTKLAAISGTNTGNESATTIGALINSAASKATPVNADSVAIRDSVGGLLQQVTWANIKATIKTYFDTLYQTVLVSGTNLRTVNSNTLLGSTDIVVQATLVSATNIKTVNSTTILGSGDLAVGYLNIPQNSQSVAYTTVLADQGKHLLHPAADTTARIFTIDSNANVAFQIGTAITFINQNAAGVLTIAITTDTMRLAGAGTTGPRTLAANGIATAIKLTATEWIISGTGLT